VALAWERGHGVLPRGRRGRGAGVAAGGSVVIIGQDPGKVDGTVTTLAKDGKACGITADLADRMQAERVCRQLAGEHADATLLVNAAGLFVPTPFLDYDGACYDAYLELDRAIFFLTQTLARGMIAHGQGGSIVNIGSMWAHQAIAATPSSAYSLAKAGLHALTRNLAMELAPHQIRVNAVAPAVVATPIYERFVPKDQLEQTLHSFDGLHPLGRTGTPRDLANTITFLLPGHQLGHRCHLGRRRRRHGRTQLTTRTPRAPGGPGPAHGQPASRGDRNRRP
jgi:NAD(P)-dependent dehydrogenase (short-subunit alcohol dehydrogenase family)